MVFHAVVTTTYSSGVGACFTVHVISAIRHSFGGCRLLSHLEQVMPVFCWTGLHTNLNVYTKTMLFIKI